MPSLSQRALWHSAYDVGGKEVLGLTFPEFVDELRPDCIIFPPEKSPDLSASDMLDQACALRDAFGGRWPSNG